MGAEFDREPDAPRHDHSGVDKTSLSTYAFRVMAMKELLVERGLVSEEELEATREAMERRTPALGARLVARAWTDPGFCERLLADAHATAAELGIDLPASPRITVLANTDNLRHLIVCTLCSCYPRALLGRPPDWYKSFNYRSRAVREPRAVLEEFGIQLTDGVAVRVVDSTADHRYVVLPQRPIGTEALSEEELAELVTRDSMIGTGLPGLETTASR
jgi:nitrile hydratase subunit alpha